MEKREGKVECVEVRLREGGQVVEEEERPQEAILGKLNAGFLITSRSDINSSLCSGVCNRCRCYLFFICVLLKQLVGLKGKFTKKKKKEISVFQSPSCGWKHLEAETFLELLND